MYGKTYHFEPKDRLALVFDANEILVNLPLQTAEAYQGQGAGCQNHFFEKSILVINKKVMLLKYIQKL